MNKLLRRLFAVLLIVFAFLGMSSARFTANATRETAAETVKAVYSLNEALNLYNGSGTERNLEGAFEAMLQCAETSPAAYDYLGTMYSFGIGTERNPERARYYFLKAYEAGSIFSAACVNGYWIYDKDILYSLLPDGAGDAYSLGMTYYFGIEEKQNFNEAFSLFDKAYTLGNPYGAYGLGLCYLHGNGCEQDISRAMRFFEEASVNGCIEACEKQLTLIEDENLLRTVSSRYHILLKRAALNGAFDYRLEYVNAAGLKPGDASFIAYREMFDVNLESPETAEDYLVAGVYFLTAGNYSAFENDSEQGLSYLEKAASLGETYSAMILSQIDRYTERETARIQNEQKLAAKQLEMPEGMTATLSEKERVKFRTPDRVKSIVKNYLFNSYNAASDYWLLYTNVNNELKVRIVYIPSPKDGQPIAVYDRFSDAKICSLDSLPASGYVSMLSDYVNAKTKGFSDCRLLSFYSLDETHKLYDALSIPDSFRLFQMNYIYSGYFSGDYRPDTYYLTQELLGILYIDLIPEAFIPY